MARIVRLYYFCRNFHLDVSQGSGYVYVTHASIDQKSRYTPKSFPYFGQYPLLDRNKKIGVGAT